MNITITEKFGFIIATDEFGNELNYSEKLTYFLHGTYKGTSFEKCGCYLKANGRGKKITKELTEWFDEMDKTVYEKFYK